MCDVSLLVLGCCSCSLQKMQKHSDMSVLQAIYGLKRVFSGCSAATFLQLSWVIDREYRSLCALPMRGLNLGPIPDTWDNVS